MQVDNISLEQMLVGLYRANRHAFSGDNMNRLLVGKVIQAPAEEVLHAISQQDALQEIRLHAENWNAYHSRLTAAVARAQPAAGKATQQSETGKVTATMEDKAAPGEPRDVVKLSKSEFPAEAQHKGAASDEKLRTLEEEAIAQDRAIQEVSERIAFFEQQIKDMQQLLLAQNQILAELQKGGKPAALAEQSPAASPASVADPPVAVVAPPPAKINLFDRLSANPALLGGALALLALLGGLLLFLRSKRDRQMNGLHQGDFAPGELASQTASAQRHDTGLLNALAMPTGKEKIHAADIDPISEAEVYIAYGRDAQAEEILKHAIAKEPTRQALYLKLLEVYAHRKDADAFDRLAGGLLATVGSTSPVWKEVSELCRTFKPGNPIYPAALGIAAASAAAEPEREPPMTAASRQQAEHEHVLDFAPSAPEERPVAREQGDEVAEGSRSVATQGETGSIAMAIPAEPESIHQVASTPEFMLTQQTPEQSSTLRLEAEAFGVAEELSKIPEDWTPIASDLAASNAQTDVPKAAPADEPAGDMPAATGVELAETSVEEITLDLSELPGLENEPAEAAAPEILGLEALAVPKIGEAEPTPAEFAEVPEMPVVPEIVEVIYPTEELEVLPADTVAAQIGDAAGPGGQIEEILIKRPAQEAAELDFNFDAGVGADAGPPAAADAKVQPLPDLKLPNLDLAAISLDLGEPAGAAEEIALFGSESADVDTKLDLVTAYLDMGDTEGARELLEEVLREGSSTQRERARKVLDSLQ